MNIPAHILPILLQILSMTACGKIELPEKDGSANGGQSSVSADLPHVSVAEAQVLPFGTPVVVTGYIVGYVSGNSLSGAFFDVPYDDENTNVLIADDAWETDLADVMPIQLSKNTAPRAALDLFAHPENLYRRVSIEGTIDEYFSVCGLKKVKGYVWQSELPDPGGGGEDPDNPDDGEGGGGDDSGTEQEKTIPVPGISDATTFVREGR